MQRRIVAHELAAKLGAVETQLDHTLIAAGALLSALPDARFRAKLSAVVGQDALDLVVQATAILSQARGKMVEAHHALAATGQEIGVGKIVAELGDKTVPKGEAEAPSVVTHIRAA